MNPGNLDTSGLSKEVLVELVTMLEEQEKAHEEDKLDLYKPHAGQKAFHACNAKIRLMVTGNRFGKTTASVFEAIWLALGIHPFHKIRIPNRGKLYCESYATFMESIAIKFEEWLPKKYLDKRKPVTKNPLGQITGYNFANGSMIKVGTYDQKEAKSESSNWHWVGFDEPPSRELYVANLRGVIDFGGLMWFSMTPLSEPWIFDELYEPGLNKSKKYVEVFEGDSRDNPHLDKESLQIFMDELTPQEFDVRVKGKFKKLQGLVIDTYDPFLSDIDPFELDERFVIYEGLDPHPSKPNAALWKAVDPDGFRYAVAELWFDGGIRDFGLEVAATRQELCRKGARLVDSVADTSLNQKDMAFKINQFDEFKRALREMGEEVVPVLVNKAQGLFASIQKLKDVFRPVILNQEQPEVRRPHEYLFKGQCPRYKWELAHHQWPKDPTDTQKPIDKNNDLIACSRYIETRAPKFVTPGQSTFIRRSKDAYRRLTYDERMSRNA